MSKYTEETLHKLLKKDLISMVLYQPAPADKSGCCQQQNYGPDT